MNSNFFEGFSVKYFPSSSFFGSFDLASHDLYPNCVFRSRYIHGDK